MVVNSKEKPKTIVHEILHISGGNQALLISGVDPGLHISGWVQNMWS